MNPKISWKNITEEAAYARLQELLPILKKLGLSDAQEALALLLKRRDRRNEWDWGVFEDFVNLFKNEFSQQDPNYKEGFRIIDHVLDKTFAIKRKKGRLMNPFEVSWTDEEKKRLDASLGVLTGRLQAATDVETAALLAGLGHIIRYETKGAFVRRRLHAWAEPSLKSPKDREALVEDFLTIKTKGTDGRADTTHIRNAFAHAKFEFAGAEGITVWDTDDRGNETFRKTLAVADLLGLFNMFEKKLALAETYPSLMAAVNDLYHVYKRDWKAFNR